jgi:glycosyltransferase involved in cell wall biosynthesis
VSLDAATAGALRVQSLDAVRDSPAGSSGMRLAFLSVSARMGGSEVLLLQLLRELRASRPHWMLHLLVPAEGPLASGAAALGVAVRVVPMPPALRRLGEWSPRAGRPVRLMARLARAAAAVPRYQAGLARALKAIDPDIVHTNGFKAHVLAARMARGRAALVWHIHEYVGARPVTRRLIRHYARLPEAIVANSTSVAADVRHVAGARARVHVIHNAVDLERFSPSGAGTDLDARASLPAAPGGTIRVGLVATFSRWKGHETFLRALSLLAPSDRVRGYVIGGALYDTEGSQHTLGELQSMAAGLGLAGRVGFTGFIDAPETALRALDIVVHASTEPEAFGLVIAEAMACGRAVVTSGTGGSSELVRDGEDAVTHRPADFRDLASRLSQLASDAPLRRRLGAAARASAARHFDARRLADQFAAVYDDARRRRAAR